MSSRLHKRVVKVLAHAGLQATRELLLAVAAHLATLLSPAMVRQTAAAKMADHSRRGCVRILAQPPSPRIDKPTVAPGDPNAGFVVNRSGQCLTESEWLGLLRRARTHAGRYRSSYVRQGKVRQRWRPTRGILALLVTFSSVDLGKLRREASLTWYRGAGYLVMQEFERLTDLHAIGLACHLAEGCPHYHIVFNKVGRDGDRVELLPPNPAKPEKRRGRRSLHCWGIARVAQLRRGLAGLPTHPGWLRDRALINDRTANGAPLPLDWALSAFVDQLVRSSAFGETVPSMPPASGASDDVDEPVTAAHIHRLRKLRTALRTQISHASPTKY